jgi:septum site-determining protein MinC
MTSDIYTSPNPPLATEPAARRDWYVQIQVAEGEIQLVLPSLAEANGETGWMEIWEQLQQRLSGAKRFWQPMAPVHVYAQDRLMDARQLQMVAQGLEDVQLSLRSVHTSRRQTAVAAATAGYSVQQYQPDLVPSKEVLNSEPLYLQMTVRSGVEVRHPGTIVLVGDVNPGGAVIAAGDILVWGRLRGIAHAGSAGNENCLIMALQMNPTQLRIAGYVARSPEQGPEESEPEIAHILNQAIRITAAADSKSIAALVDRHNSAASRKFV